MSRILRRPMFRGGRVAKENGGVMDIYESFSEKIPMPERRKPKGLSTGDYLRIASAGLDILGAPSEGSGFKGALASASKPLSQLGVDLGTSIDKREAQTLEDYQDAVDKRNEKIMGLTGAQAEMDIGALKAQGDFGRRLVAFDAVYETKRENIRNNENLSDEDKKTKLAEIDAAYNQDKEYYLIKGGDVSDFFKLGSNTEAIKAAEQVGACPRSDGLPMPQPHLDKWVADEILNPQLNVADVREQYVDNGGWVVVPQIFRKKICETFTHTSAIHGH